MNFCTEVSPAQLCAQKRDDVTTKLTRMHHNTKVLNEIYRLDIDQAVTSALIGNYETSTQDELGMTSIGVSGRTAVIVNTSAQEIEKIKATTFKHTCGQCNTRQPLERCNADNPPNNAIIQEIKEIQ